jgi:hypothetical protein
MIPGLGFRVFPLGEVIDADAFWNEEETAIFEDESGEFYFVKEDEIIE